MTLTHRVHEKTEKEESLQDINIYDYNLITILLVLLLVMFSRQKVLNKFKDIRWQFYSTNLFCGRLLGPHQGGMLWCVPM